MEGLQSKVELLLCTCCEPFWIRGPAKRLKCIRDRQLSGIERHRGGEVRGAEGEESLQESPLGEGEEKEGGERACAAGGRNESSLSEDM